MIAWASTFVLAVWSHSVAWVSRLPSTMTVWASLSLIGHLRWFKILVLPSRRYLELCPWCSWDAHFSSKVTPQASPSPIGHLWWSKMLVVSLRRQMELRSRYSSISDGLGFSVLFPNDGSLFGHCHGLSDFSFSPIKAVWSSFFGDLRYSFYFQEDGSTSSPLLVHHRKPEILSFGLAYRLPSLV